MIAGLSDARRKSLAVGMALLVLLALGAAVVVPTWWLHQRYDKALADFGDQLARHQRIAATRDVVNTRLEKLKATQTQRRFLKSATSPVAASELQDIVRAAMDLAGVRFISIQFQPHKDEGRYRQITVSVSMSATGPALRRMLHTLESGQPFVFIDGITIRQSVGPGFRPAPGTEPEMFVQADLVAYTIGGTP
ncbi:MAG: type II secretion system protein M [Betaproteobacteria bacterium]|nr:type II secretion system protein M [Betaproteobacteria bacterium]